MTNCKSEVIVSPTNSGYVQSFCNGLPVEIQCLSDLVLDDQIDIFY